MIKIAAIFSGQGNTYQGMGKELYDNFESVRKIYQCAGDIFGFDVAKTSFEAEEEELAKTAITQPVTYTLSVAAFEAAKSFMPKIDAVAGHSLGEFAALAVAGGYSIEDGMRIVKIRAQAMERAVGQSAGTMYAVMGGDASMVEQACKDAGGRVYPANYNISTQTVISGEIDAAARAAQLLVGQGLKVVQLKVGGALHTPAMDMAAKELKDAISGFSFATTNIDFYSNVTGKKLVIEDYPSYFAAHMVGPVRFVEEIASMTADGLTTAVEFGPKKTAVTLAKKNNKAFQVYNVENIDSMKKTQEALG